MCGIIFAHGKNPEQARTAVRIQFRNQIERGTEGFGIVEVKPNIKKPRVRRALHTKNALEELDAVRSDAIMFHHRIPTSTGNTLNSTHPFRVSKGGRKIFLIHNGVLENEDDVLKKLNINPETLQSYSEFKGDKGKVYYKYNDSEALAHDFLDALITGRKELHSEGSIAIIAYEPMLNCVWMYRNGGNPLKVWEEGGLFLAASEAPVTDDIKEQNLYCYDLTKKKMRFVRKLDSQEWSSHYSKSYDRTGAWESESHGYDRPFYGGGTIPIHGNEGRKNHTLASRDPRDWIAGAEDDMPIKHDYIIKGKTDITNKDPYKRFIGGQQVYPPSKLGVLLTSSEATDELLDELTFPTETLKPETVTCVDDFYDIVERVRAVTQLLEELWVKDRTLQWFTCDSTCHGFLYNRLRDLMRVYSAVWRKYEDIVKRESWIGDAYIAAEDALVAAAELEAQGNKHNPVTQKKQQSLIGFDTN